MAPSELPSHRLFLLRFADQDPSTARSHVKHVFTKLGVRSQLQLVQVLMAGFPMPMPGEGTNKRP